jgi:hypothetical protein
MKQIWADLPGGVRFVLDLMKLKIPDMISARHKFPDSKSADWVLARDFRSIPWVFRTSGFQK